MHREIQGNICSMRLLTEKKHRIHGDICTYSEVHNFITPNVCQKFYSLHNFIEEFYVCKYEAHYEDDYLKSEDWPCNQGIIEE